MYQESLSRPFYSLQAKQLRSGSIVSLYMCDTASTKAKKNETKQQPTPKEPSVVKQSGLKDHTFHSSNSNVSTSSQNRYCSENESNKLQTSFSPKSPSRSRVIIARSNSTRKMNTAKSGVRLTKNEYSSNDNSLTTSSSGSLPVSRAHSTSASSCTLASAGGVVTRNKKHKSVFDRLSSVSKKFSQTTKPPK